ncbi:MULTISPECIES: flavin-containing monooxygenase [Nocardia]|uniref:NAD(P)/FAD-dependent oxidoreductase n=2 Tax=Nocardia TaxID=1817 RepID=A0A846XJX1_9NOCA|nr:MULTISPECIES: NAD(P)/FAD-dependent oxidoreductase [Nocardia]MBF6456120.1 NAD(P)/FAD-dependent oxidoreductase [Nocardia cyriacigeorgica]MBF6479403.1 NAD(P)/FAD-dependent oxidoreductase [Nocardia cyriacigeorgica]MBF6553140.1 NAD(P)/FAD-dependent oxidoreductase [Nocardia cyriacigeorgica]NKY34946.1 NAD(P)/FAD-dependent oxidoreductase [Nocardia speluncae]TLF77748.1 NAD(P)/FAD-dependent oxidoreductase [Nocardia cyriacigeorgica]
MTSEYDYDAVVIGGGQSGLAAAHHLTAAGLSTAVLEASPEATGSWPRYYDSLTLFSPARYSSLPGRRFPGGPDRYPHRDEVIDYLRSYAAALDAEIHTSTVVDSVASSDGEGFAVTTGSGAVFTAPRVIAATGSFGSPFLPAVPGRDEFGGRVLHASEYRHPGEFADQRVVVVGAGNSAVQIAAELAGHAKVVLASRAPVKFVPQRPLGRDVHFWFTLTGFDAAPLGWIVKQAPTQPVLDAGRYRAALDAGKPERREVFTAFNSEGVVWPDDTRTPVDAVVFATGYRPHLPYLAGVGAVTESGVPRQRRGLSLTHPGLGFLGLEWQRTPSSNSLRGVGRDAAYLVRRLRPATAPQREHAE